VSREERKDLIRAIEAHRGSKVICCLTSNRPNVPGVLAKDFIPIFFDHLQRFDKHDRIDTFIFTSGGDTLAAFGISCLIREFVGKGPIGCLVPETCHSGGTLIAIGADEIVMTRAATLSPIDPSIAGPLNPQVEPFPGQRQIVPVSVESVAGFKDLIQRDWKLNSNGENVAFRILAEKINPLTLGDVYRSREQIPRLASKLLQSHREDRRNIKRIIKKLTTELGSHDYLIFRAEAREMLGSQVLPDDPKLESLLWDLFRDFRAEMQLGKFYDPEMELSIRESSGTTPGQTLNIKLQIVVIESSVGRDVWERDISLSRVQMPSPAGPQLVVAQRITYNTWRHYD